MFSSINKEIISGPNTTLLRGDLSGISTQAFTWGDGTAITWGDGTQVESGS